MPKHPERIFLIEKKEYTKKRGDLLKRNDSIQNEMSLCLLYRTILWTILILTTAEGVYAPLVASLSFQFFIQSWMIPKKSKFSSIFLVLKAEISMKECAGQFRVTFQLGEWTIIMERCDLNSMIHYDHETILVPQWHTCCSYMLIG